MHTEITKDSFLGQDFYVGIDCHKTSWKVTILGEHFEHKTMSQDPSPKTLASYLKRNFPGGSFKAVYEAGFSGFGWCRELRDLGIDCMVIHPADVPITNKEKHQKTDKADSRKLARSLRSHEFKPIDIPDLVIEADRALIRQRFRQSKDLSRTKNRIKSLLLQFGITIPEQFTKNQTRHMSGPYINWLKSLDFDHSSLRQTLNNYIRIAEIQKGDLLQLEKQVKALSSEDRYASNHALLLSTPGIGSISGITFLTQIREISRFRTLDQLCNYIGLVPSMYGSGEKMQVGKLTNRGRKDLKIILIEAAWIAVRRDPALMLKFNELSKRMPKNKAIIKIARKLLARMCHVLKTKQPYVIGVIE